MSKCLDIGAIQAFLDGELDFERSETVAHHIAACDDCAMMLAEAEEESAFAFTALEQEFNTLVPTQRLWTKINDSIEQEKKSFWTPIFAFFKQPAFAAFASLLVVVGLFALVLNRGNVEEKSVAQVEQTNKNIIVPTLNPIAPTVPPISSPIIDLPTVKTAAVKNNRTGIRVIEARFVKENRTPKPPHIIIDRNQPQPANDTLTGEDSYIKTIATLTETVNNRKDEVLKPSARFAFERDLAVADNAIKTMKAEIKQNPKDEGAKQILRSSYQNKIDLLSSVADKTELMASLK